MGNFVRNMFIGRFAAGFDPKMVNLDKDTIPVVMCRSGKMLDAEPARYIPDSVLAQMKDVYTASGRRKMFNNHAGFETNFFGDPRDPQDILAVLEGKPEIKRVGDYDLLIDNMKVLSGNDKREAFRQTILEAPDQVEFSVAIAAKFEVVRINDSDDEMVYKMMEVKDFYSCDWVCEGATGIGIANFNRKQLEEGMKMTLDEFKKNFPAEWAKAEAEFAAKVDAQVEEKVGAAVTVAVDAAKAEFNKTIVDGTKTHESITALTAQVATLTASVQSLEVANGELKATAKAAAFNASKSTLLSKMAELATASSVPSQFHAEMYFSDDRITGFIDSDGKADATKFETEFKVVVTSWEEKFAKVGVKGAGKGKDGSFSQGKGDEEKAEFSAENKDIVSRAR